MPENMDLWEKVCETDPKFTKNFVRSQGFKGLAINPTYLARKATELWGSIGFRWGFTIEDEKLVPGAPFIENGAVVGHETIHVVTIKVWYPTGDKDAPTGYVQHKGQTTFCGKNKYGYFTDEEAPKKSVTDGLSKCLSMLGFSADVYLGSFDGDKYTTSPQSQPEPPSQPTRQITLPPGEDSLKRAMDAIAQAKTKEDLARVRAKYSKSGFSSIQIKGLDEAHDTRLQSMK